MNSIKCPCCGKTIATDIIKSLSPKYILTETIRYYEVPYSRLVSKSRKRDYAYARQVFIYLCRTYTRATYLDIGAMVGMKDHTTAIHGYNRIKGMLDVEDDAVMNIYPLIARIESYTTKLAA